MGSYCAKIVELYKDGYKVSLDMPLLGAKIHDDITIDDYDEIHDDITIDDYDEIHDDITIDDYDEIHDDITIDDYDEIHPVFLNKTSSVKLQEKFEKYRKSWNRCFL